MIFLLVPPAIAGEYEETIEVIVGESVLLPCEVTGSPQPSVSWNQNFLPLVPDSTRMEVQTSGLYISETQSSDKAFYECVATNVAGDRSKIFSLAVYSKSHSFYYIENSLLKLNFHYLITLHCLC